MCKYHFCDIKSCCSPNNNCNKLGNGECDTEFNIKECLWDAGDCLTCDEDCYLINTISSHCNNSCYPKDYNITLYQKISDYNNNISTNSIIHHNRRLSLLNLTSSSDMIIQIKDDGAESAFFYDIAFFSDIASIKGNLLSNEKIFTVVNFSFEGNFTSNNMALDNYSYPFYMNFTNNSIINITETIVTNHTDFSLSINATNGGDYCFISVIIQQVNNTVLVVIVNCDDITIPNFSSNGVSLALFSVNASFLLSSMNISNAQYSMYNLINLQDSQILSNISNLTLVNTEFHNSSILNINYSVLSLYALQTVNFSFPDTRGLINVYNESKLFITNGKLWKSEEYTSILFTFDRSTVSIANSIFSVEHLKDTVQFKLAQLILINSSFSCNFKDLPDKMNESEFNLVIAAINYTNCPKFNMRINQEKSYCNLDRCIKYNQFCDKGDFKLLGVVCYQCPENYFAYHEYTIHGLIDNPTCFECSDNMTCKMNMIYPNPGVWRFTGQSEFPLVFRECPLPAACINDYTGEGDQNKTQFLLAMQTPKSPPTICRDGYFGNFCNDCSDNFTKTSADVCSGCPEVWINILIIVIIVILFITVSYYLITTTVDAAFEPDELYSIGLRIFVNYFQIIYLCFQYKLQWPPEIKKISILNASSSTTSQVPSPYYFFSFKCLLHLSHINISEQEIFYGRTYFMILLPILLYALSWSIIFILKCAKKIRHVENYKTVLLIIPFLLVYPSVVTYSFSPLACISLLDGAPDNFDEHTFGKMDQSYLLGNLNIECNWDYYYKVFWCTALGILAWGIGVPLYIFIQIFKQRKNLFEYEIKYKYGFMFNGYHKSRYYWEFVILLKKFIIVLLTVFMASNFQQNLQSILIIVSLITFLILQIYFKPYISDEINRLEIFASITAISTVILGVVYVSLNVNWAQLAIAILIITINLAFVTYWLKFMTKEVVSYVVKSFEFLRKRYYTHDPFEEDSVKENKFSSLYIKENQKIYTQISLEKEDTLRFGDVQTPKDLHLKIMETDINQYKNNQGPNINRLPRQQTIYSPAIRSKLGLNRIINDEL